MKSFYAEANINQQSVPLQVAKFIRQAILDGRIKAGDKLPSEDHIAQEFGVSRGPVREAFGILKSDGLLESRRGASGGTFVARPGLGQMVRGVVDFYQFGDLGPEEMTDFRHLIEPNVMTLAAERRTEEDLKLLAQNIEQCQQALDEGVLNIAPHFEFHILASHAAHNRLLFALMNALFELYKVVYGKVVFTEDESRADLGQHWEILEAIRNRDGEKARQILINHFQLAQQVFKRKRESKT